MSKPLAIDLYAGLGGWSDGLLAENYDVVGFDIERHVYGEHRYPAQLVIQDVLTLHGSQFRDAALIVASPPCQGYSYRAMPWSRAKALAPPDNTLFEACFRIQREACEAAGRHIPMVVENVRGAQKWVGRARWNFGSYYLWGDVPALMPITLGRGVMKHGIAHRPNGETNFHGHTKNNGGSWFAIANNKDSGLSRNPVSVPGGYKSSGMNWSDQTKRGQDFTRIAGRQAMDGRKHYGDCFNDPSWPGKAGGTKQGGTWWHDDGSISRTTSSRSPARKAASAMIAKIPFALARHIAAVYRPREAAPCS